MTEEKAGRVFLVQEPPPIRDVRTGRYITKDLSSANRYGMIIPILNSSDQASLTPGPIMNVFMRSLHEFDKEKDYLCFAGGDPVSLALAMLALRDMGHVFINLLRWERERSPDGKKLYGGFYVPVKTKLYA